MNFLFEKWSSLQRWVYSLSFQFKVAILFTFIAMAGMVLIMVVQLKNYENALEKHLLAKVDGEYSDSIYLVGKDGEILSHPGRDSVLSDILQESIKMLSAYEDGVYHVTLQDIPCVVVVKKNSDTGDKIVCVMPKDSLFWNRDRFRMMTILHLSLSVLILFFVNQYVALQIANPLKKLEKSIRGIEIGSRPAVYIGGPPEIQHLGLSILFMVEELQNLSDKMVKEQEEKRKNELDALQAQINPHFLYNTLDSIMWMVESERHEDAVSMIQALGRLLRISLSKGKMIIPVGSELQHARSYLAIQNYRYKNKFRFYFEIEPGIEQYTTIKLVLQPLIENAIYHGMEYMDGDGEIHIRAYTRGWELYLEVEDNGPGIPQEQVKQLLTDGEKAGRKGAGMGLKNVNQRIRLYFGEPYGLEIESEPDEGTRVRIHLPKTLRESGGASSQHF